MKKLALLFLPVLFYACEKESVLPARPPSHVPMLYSDLGNVPVKFGQQKSINLNGDNTIDLLFSTVLVGDPVLRRDRRQYYVNADFDVFLLTDAQEQAPVLNRDESITINDPADYHWFNASSVVLAEKIIEENGQTHWEGSWKNADRKYLPVQIRKNDLRYVGWIEISFNTNTEEAILHRAAIAAEPGKTITSGH